MKNKKPHILVKICYESDKGFFPSAFSFGIKCFIWQNKIVKIAYIFIFLILCFALCFDSNYASSS